MDGIILKTFVDQKRLNKTKLAAALGMSKQNLYQLFESREFKAETVRSIENHFKTKWAKIKSGVNIDVSEAGQAGLSRNAPADYRAKYIQVLEDRANLEKKIVPYALTNQALLKTIVEWVAMIHAKAEKRKPGEVQVEMNNRVEQHLQALRKDGI